MTKKWVFLFSFVTLTIVITHLSEIEAQTPVACDFYSFIKGSGFQTAAIKADAPPKNYFQKEGSGCPQLNNAACQGKAYLIPGDKVITSQIPSSSPGWICSLYLSAKGKETIGWLSQNILTTTSTPSIRPPIDWIGKWKAYDTEINLKNGKNPQEFFVDGYAVLHTNTPGGDRTGDLYGPATLQGNHLTLVSMDRVDPKPCQDQYCCQAQMDLVGNYLIVSDNSQCGGVSVSFNGIYEKKK